MGSWAWPLRLTWRNSWRQYSVMPNNPPPILLVYSHQNTETLGLRWGRDSPEVREGIHVFFGTVCTPYPTTCIPVAWLNTMYTSTDPVNISSLRDIETAMFTLCLDRSHPHVTSSVSFNDPQAEVLAKRALHGNGTKQNSCNRWYDSAVQVSYWLFVWGLFVCRDNHNWKLSKFLLSFVAGYRRRWWVWLYPGTLRRWRTSCHSNEHIQHGHSW